MRDILKLTPFANGIPVDAFEFHPKLDHHTARGRVTHEVPSLNSMEAKRLEPKRHECPTCLRAVAVIPIGYADPVPDLCLRMDAADSEVDRANEFADWLQRDRVHDVAAVFPLPRMSGNPRFRGASRIRVRNIQRRIGDFTSAREPFDRRGIA